MGKTGNERRRKIHEIVLEQGRTNIESLAEHFKVTPETIRRDVNLMAEQGLLYKGHGYVETSREYFQLALPIKETAHVSEKEQIAKKAIELIEDNMVVYLDPSTISIRMVKYLPLRKNLTIVTNCLDVALGVLQTRHQLILAGGAVNKKSHASIGSFAIQTLDSIIYDIAFHGTDGFANTNGPTTFSLEELQVKQYVMNQAKTNILICDSSKFEKVSEYKFARFEEFDILLTNSISFKQRKQVEKIPKVISVG